MKPEELYRVYFQGLKYDRPCHEVVKLLDGDPVSTYLVTAKACQCPGYERHHKYCRHLLLRDYYEAHSRPVCFLRVSGGIHIFESPLTDENSDEGN